MNPVRIRVLRAALTAAAALTLAVPAGAQILGQYSGLYPLAGGRKELGVFLGTGSGDMGVTAQGRVGSTRTLGYDLQMASQNSRFAAQLGALAGLMRSSGDYPLVLGGQLAGGLLTGGGSTGPYIQGVPGLSVEWDAGSGQVFSLWGGLGLRIMSSTKAAGSSDAIYRLGGRFDYSSDFGFATNLESVDGNSTISVGMQYRFGNNGNNRP